MQAKSCPLSPQDRHCANRSTSESRELAEGKRGFAFSIMWARHESWVRITSLDARRVRRRGETVAEITNEIDNYVLSEVEAKSSNK
jgi:predicted Ser/Thr protein kinase